MDNIIETQRKFHEQVDRLELMIVQCFLQPKKTHKENLLHQLRARRLLELLSDRATLLRAIYSNDSIRQNEIDMVSGEECVSEFYKRLRSIKDSHRKNQSQELDDDYYVMVDEKLNEVDEMFETAFTGEERYGRNFDLVLLHEEYLNIKGLAHCNYLTFIDKCVDFDSVPLAVKKCSEYERYLSNLKNYLSSFCSRAQPLTEVESLPETKSATVHDDLIHCEACNKSIKKAVFKSHATGRKHLKNVNLLVNGQSDKRVSNTTSRLANVEKLESEVTLLMSHLNDFREETKQHVERKQSQNADEREDDIEEEEFIEEITNEDSDDDDKPYNPLKLPLGWDGKPIPFWLYKLHGLGVEYPCEICANFVYMGSKAFEKHFQESRHAHGMRCLGIPNTKQFHGIIKIQEAYELYEKIKENIKEDVFQPETMEEFEDAEGNVFNKRTYDDLRRQGLI